MAFPEAKLKALEEKISHPRWVVPVLPEQELEALLIASSELAQKGMSIFCVPSGKNATSLNLNLLQIIQCRR